MLIIDSDFSDITVCTFWLAPGAPLRTYTMRTHTTKAWTNAAIYFYAATKGQDGGFYQLDNVSLTLRSGGVRRRGPTVSIRPRRRRTGGAPGADLITNGHFQAGGLSGLGASSEA